MLFISAILTGYYDFAIELAEKFIEGKEKDLLKNFALNSALLPTQSTLHDLQSTLQRAQSKPADANIEIGRFIDRHRRLPDYDDVKD